MTLEISALNWLGVLCAFIAYFFLGAMWFTVLFKKQYLKSLGKEDNKQQSTAAIFIVGPAICTLVVTITSAILMNALQVGSYQDAITFAAIVGFGYLFANTINIAINPNMPRPIFYGIISGMYHIIGISICCVILFAMK